MTFLAIVRLCGAPGWCGGLHAVRASGVESAGRDAEGRAPKATSAEMPSDPYLAEVTKFRQDREATLKGNAGWLTIAGLWFLTQPQTTFGSDPLERHRLSGERAAARGHLRDAQRQGDGEGRRGRDVSARRQAADDGGAEVGRAGAGRSPVARERSAVLGAQQRRASVDSPARSEQPRCGRSSPA